MKKFSFFVIAAFSTFVPYSALAATAPKGFEIFQGVPGPAYAVR
jgi:hypothetical protein